VYPKYETTPEEDAYYGLLNKEWESLSDAARTIIWGADVVAAAEYTVPSYSFSEEEYEEPLKKMRLAAARITEREHKVLARLWRAALAAAAALDSEDFDTVLWYGLYPANLHDFYRGLARMVETVLEEKRREEERQELEKELARREPTDEEEIPF
jgi:hypothetical protein